MQIGFSLPYLSRIRCNCMQLSNCPITSIRFKLHFLNLHCTGYFHPQPSHFNNSNNTPPAPLLGVHPSGHSCATPIFTSFRRDAPPYVIPKRRRSEGSLRRPLKILTARDGLLICQGLAALQRLAIPKGPTVPGTVGPQSPVMDRHPSQYPQSSELPVHHQRTKGPRTYDPLSHPNSLTFLPHIAAGEQKVRAITSPTPPPPCQKFDPFRLFSSPCTVGPPA